MKSYQFKYSLQGYEGDDTTGSQNYCVGSNPQYSYMGAENVVFHVHLTIFVKIFCRKKFVHY